jgi:hypothetical protein
MTSSMHHWVHYIIQNKKDRKQHWPVGMRTCNGFTLPSRNLEQWGRTCAWTFRVDECVWTPRAWYWPSSLACACAILLLHTHEGPPRLFLPRTRTLTAPVTLPLDPFSLRAGGTQEPGWGRVCPVRRTLGTLCAPSAGPRLAAPLPLALGPCLHNSLNIPLKHEAPTWNTGMQHKSEADETFRTYICNICVKHIQH